MPSTTPHSERLHGLDALRGIALILGVVLHASLSYLPTPIWLFPDDQPSPVAKGPGQDPTLPHIALTPQNCKRWRRRPGALR